MMVEGGDGEPYAGLEVPASQQPVGSLLELIPTTFSHTLVECYSRTNANSVFSAFSLA